MTACPILVGDWIAFESTGVKLGVVRYVVPMRNSDGGYRVVTDDDWVFWSESHTNVLEVRRVGMPIDALDASTPACGAPNTDATMRCQLVRGHQGDHRAVVGMLDGQWK